MIYLSVIQLRGKIVRRPGKSRPTLGVHLDTEDLIDELGLGRRGLGDRSEAAARLLSRRGTAASDATKKLREVLRTRGPRFPPRVTTPTRNFDRQIHRWAAVALTRVARSPSDAAAGHGYLVLFGNPLERQSALRQLRTHPASSDAAVPYLIKGLRGEDRWMPKISRMQKEQLIITLGALGKKSKPATKVLKTYAAGADRFLADSARAALRDIAPAGKIRVIR